MKVNSIKHAVEIDSHRGGRCFYAGISGITTTDFKHAFKRGDLSQAQAVANSPQFRTLNPKIVSQ